MAEWIRAKDSLPEDDVTVLAVKQLKSSTRYNRTCQPDQNPTKSRQPKSAGGGL